ncbi:MAG: ABC transporter permease [Candidatus Kerfeldbacteria bacterium]
MKFNRVFAVTRKQFLALRHDPRSIALMLLAPIMAMLIFGFAFGTEPHNVPVVIVNQDQGLLAEKIIANIDSEKLSVTSMNDGDAARALVQDGKKIAAILFSSDFSSNLTPSTINSKTILPHGASVTIVLDTTSQQLSSVVKPTLMNAAQALIEAGNATVPVSFDLAYAFPKAKDARYIDYFVPGIMAFAVTLFTTLLTLLAFVGERTSGTLDRLRVTPATEAEIVLGYETAFGIIATIQGILLLTVALLIYHILIVGPLVVAALIIALTAIDAQAIGILISAGARREGQAIQFFPFIVLPVFLLSGIFIPVQSLPNWLQPFSYLLPPTWSIEALRDVLLRGWGLGHVWIHVLVLVGFAVVFTLLAVVSLKRSRQ